MVGYGYSRLVGYPPELKFAPALAQSVDIEEDRSFTFHPRPGHKWSAGEPFTSEDFRYWYEDIALNKMISPSGLPRELLADGENPKAEFIDPLTTHSSSPNPNPRSP